MNESITPGVIYQHKKEHYLVRVESSTRYGYTSFRRVIALNPKAGNPLRTKKTHYFRGEFEPVQDYNIALSAKAQKAYDVYQQTMGYPVREVSKLSEREQQAWVAVAQTVTP